MTSYTKSKPSFESAPANALPALVLPVDSSDRRKDMHTSTVAFDDYQTKYLYTPDNYRNTVDYGSTASQARPEGKLGRQPIISYVLSKVHAEVSMPEWHLYRTATGRYKQVYELIGENKTLRELVKKISAHFNHQIEKSRLRDMHEDRQRVVASKYGSKNSTEEEQMATRIKVNEKYDCC
jgi:hypothetical protein